MSALFLLTNAAEPAVEIMPALGLLLHTVRTGPADMIAFEDAAAADAILVDARRDLIAARQLCQLLRRSAPQAPVLALMTEGGLAAVTAEWGADDVLLSSAGPAEVEARLRLAIGRQASVVPTAPDEIRSGELSIDEATYTARLRARVLDLTFKEFELLKFLAQHPGRVFTRAHLLQEVWGYDYFGGTRTAARPGARPDVQGVRAAQIPRPAPWPGVHPCPPAAGGVGLRLLRRHPHGCAPGCST